MDSKKVVVCLSGMPGISAPAKCPTCLAAVGSSDEPKGTFVDPTDKLFRHCLVCMDNFRVRRKVGVLLFTLTALILMSLLAIAQVRQWYDPNIVQEAAAVIAAISMCAGGVALCFWLWIRLQRLHLGAVCFGRGVRVRYYEIIPGKGMGIKVVLFNPGYAREFIEMNRVAEASQNIVR